jgi:hypothetical protein
MKYLKQFIIGSSYLVFVSFYYAVQNNQPKKNYDYYDYTLVAPVWFGLWNVLSLIIAESLGLSTEHRFLLISILSSFSIMTIATHLKSYNFTKKEWNDYYLHIFLKYLVTWNFVIYNLEKFF